MKKAALFAAAVLTLGPRLATADVLDSSATGFTLKITQQIQAAPAEVYRKIVFNVGDWWDPEHTYSHNSHNLTMESKAQGCFCEKTANQGSVRHMEVVMAAPGERLVLSGGLGPLQAVAATGVMTFRLSAVAGGTKLEVTYAVGGYIPAGMSTWAQPVDTVLAEQLTRLKNFIEHGSPDPK
jgi:uncharacterized protein YndB with AHSA1/START domain